MNGMRLMGKTWGQWVCVKPLLFDVGLGEIFCSTIMSPKSHNLSKILLIFSFIGKRRRLPCVLWANGLKVQNQWAVANTIHWVAHTSSNKWPGGLMDPSAGYHSSPMYSHQQLFLWVFTFPYSSQPYDKQMRSHEKIKEGISSTVTTQKNALTDHSCLNVAQSSMTQSQLSQISLEAIDLSRNAVSPNQSNKSFNW
jgi:hypothetical protein